MAFADPQSVTVNAVAQPLPRVSTGANSSVYQKDDATYKLTLSHQYGKRNRHTARLDNRKIAPDVFTSDNTAYSMSVYLVIDTPLVGYTNAELKQIVDGLTAYLTASTGANVTKLLGGEN
jgi:hypothetical protein